MAEIHPQLQQDCLTIGRFKMCYLLLMRDANYPWFVLVPDREGITEIYQLSKEDQHQLIEESSYLASILMKTFQADKMNIAAIGNIVSQLHIHHVVRYRDDAAWPAPVWGKVPVEPYTEAQMAIVITKLKEVLTDSFEFFGK